MKHCVECFSQRFWRLVYTLILCFLLPWAFIYLFKRGRKQPAYRAHWAQRFLGQTGLLHARSKRLWVHAVSVGETHAIAPLVHLWQEHYPDTQWVFTTTTPTGRATAQQLFAGIDSACFVYLPYDLPWAMQRFLGQVNPAMAWFVETELWPNLLAVAQRQAIPVYLLNARVSPATQRRWQRYQVLLKPALSRLGLVVAQSPADAVVFAAQGRPVDAVCGNLKFDVQPSEHLLSLGRLWKKDFFEHNFIILAASTREGEENLLLKAWRKCLDTLGKPYAGKIPVLLIVPRHPQRFDEVASLCVASGFSVVRRSQGFVNEQPSALGEQGVVYLGDSMGEMPAYYALADIAVMGGSWLPFGGQNLIEACACDCPVILGPHTFNFAAVSEHALAAGAALRFTSLLDALLHIVGRWQTSKRFIVEQKSAENFAKQHRGATQATFELIVQRFEIARLN